jgi:putative membrane protein
MAKAKKMRERSMVKGALAGLVGGIAGSGAKALAKKVYSPRIERQTHPQPALDGQVAERPPLESENPLKAAGRRLVFGAVAGAVYGAAVELQPKAAAWRGAGFGLALNKLAHEISLDDKGPPKIRLAEATVRQRTQERQSEWVTHAVYGVVTEVVRRLVRKGL